MLWFSAPTRLNQTLDNQGIKIAKYHEAVNMAIAYAISKPFGGAHTTRSCMLTTVAAVLHKTPSRTWDMNKQMKGWEMEGRLELLPFVDDDVGEVSDVHWERSESRRIFTQRRCVAFLCRPLVLHPRKRLCRQ